MAGGLIGAYGPIVFMGGQGTAIGFHSISKTNKQTLVKHRIISSTDLVESTGPDLIELNMEMHFHGPYTLSPSAGIAALEAVMASNTPLPLIIGRVPTGRGLLTLFVVEAIDSKMSTFVGSGLAVADVSVKLLEYPNPLPSGGPLSALGGALPGLSGVVGAVSNIANIAGNISGIAGTVAGIAGAIPGLGGIAGSIGGVVNTVTGTIGTVTNTLSSVTGGIVGISNVTSAVGSAIASIPPGGVSGIISATGTQIQGAVASLTAAGKAVLGTVASGVPH
jgi:Phage P2 GpU